MYKFSSWPDSTIFKLSSGISKQERKWPDSFLGHCPDTFLGHCPYTCLGHCPDTFLGQCPDTFLGHCPDTLLGHCTDTVLGDCPDTFLCYCPDTFLCFCPDTILGYNPETFIGYCLLGWSDLPLLSIFENGHSPAHRYIFMSSIPKNWQFSTRAHKIFIFKKPQGTWANWFLTRTKET